MPSAVTTKSNGIQGSNSESKSVPVAVLFVLHGRFGHSQDKSTNDLIQTILEYSNHAGRNGKHLIVVSFDQRNHGTRTVNVHKNKAWKDNFPHLFPVDPTKAASLDNSSHAVDMYSIQTGTARDVSSMIDLLPAFLFPNGDRTIEDYYLAGVSLGGHATWLGMAHDPRISIGIPIIGSPDYHTLLNHRATHTPPPLGPLALTPPLYPAALRTFVDQHDPVNVPLSNWTGKKLLICSGATDQLVNYVDGGAERFVNVLKKEGVLIDVFVQEGCGHRCSKEMALKAAEFIFQHGLSIPRVVSQAKI